MTHSRGFASLARTVLALAVMFAATTATAQTPVDTGLAWLNAHQNPNGTWGPTPELVPRDTARALIAQSLLNRPLGAAPAAYAWLNAQSGFGANQFLAEQAMAMSLAKADNSAALAKLAAQRSASGSDFGGFADNTGDSFDSALALEALATKNDVYTAQISGLVTSLMVRQNADGGWGIDQGFASNTAMTAEVLIAFASLRAQQQPPAAILQIAQRFLAAQIHTDGSIGNGVLDTALAFRALALSGYALNTTATATLNWLGAQRSADGSWGSDPYFTARVLEAFAANKPNLVIGAGDVTVNPATAVDGANVTVSAKVTNIGAAGAPPTTLEVHLTDAAGRKLGNANVNGLAPGASQTVSITFAATTMVGKDTLFVIVDPTGALDELRKDDDSTTVLLTVVGKPDLQVFAADITTTPAHVQPNQPATLHAVIRNGGEGDANTVVWRVLDGTTQLAQATIDSISAGSSQSISVPLNLAAGSHTLNVVADPDNTLLESNETNNQASKTIGVSPLANVDLRIAPGAVTSSPAGATAGQSVTITATVDNIGNTPAQTTVGFFDGDPSKGRLFAEVPVSLDAQTSGQVSATYVVQSTTTVVYAVADPRNQLAEVDETNNQAYVALSSQFVDLSISRDGLVLPKAPLQQGQTMTARAVVRNLGVLPASNAEVIIYDDLPQLGGRAVLDTFVNVPAQGKIVVSASWTVRAGQRIATVVINPTQAVSEIDYANNRMTKLYVVSGNEADIALNGGMARTDAVDTSGVVVDANALTISGLAKINIVGSAPRPFAVTIFDDVDGDLAFNPEVDTVLGTANAQAGISNQVVQVPLQGTLRFAPGHPVVYLDSGNAVAETNESNNLIDLWQDCQGTVTASPDAFYAWRSATGSSRQAVVGRLIDTNGDDFIDDNDVPVVVTTVFGTVVVMRGDTGQVLWTRNTDGNGTNIVPIIADVDGDGKPEIIAHSSNTVSHSLICFNNDGSTKWVSPSLDRDPNWDFVLSLDGPYGYVGMPAVADLDGDGKPEIICGRSVLNGQDGTVKWVGSGGAGRVFNSDDLFSYFGSADLEGPIAVDVNGDGKLEVVAGNTVYRPDGSILWMRGDLPDGLTAPVYFANQSTPNICLVAHGSIWMLNGLTGATVWGPVGVPGGATFGGAPTVFMDGATGPWVGVAGEGHYSVLNATTGAVRWSVSTVDAGESPALTQNAATAFDFGAGERLVYSGQSHFFIFRASDGSVETKLDAHVNLPFPGAPTIADMDGDGHADIYVPDAAGGFGMLSNKTWNGAPSIYNEASYHVVNVANEEGLIPAHETQTAFSKGNWRTNVPLAPGAAGRIPQPNLVAGYPRIDASHYPSYLRLIVRVGNNGWAASNAVNVSFFNAVTNARLGVAQSKPIPAGGYDDVVFQFANPPLGAFSFYAEADRDANDQHSITECNESDNRSTTASTTVVADVAIDPTSVVASDTQPLPNSNIDLTASAVLTGTIDATALKAQWFLNAPNGTAISQPLPVIVTAGPNGSRVASVTFTWNVNVAVGQYDVYVVFDPANVIAETNESNNSGQTKINVSSTQNADIAADPALFAVSDPQPRPGDTITLGASAHLSGQFDTSLLQVQFFIGDPAAGGTPISPLIPAHIETRYNTFRVASATFNWTVNVGQGNYALYAVFDPGNAIQEVNETNNAVSTALKVSTPEIIKKLAANLTLTPPTAEVGTAVKVEALVENLGNATLASATLNYSVTGGAGTGFTGSVPITNLPKNEFADVTLGTFTPQANGTYTITLSVTESDVTLISSAKTVKVAPFATAQVTAVPKSVPISLPLIQVHTSISRTNTIVIPDDPLVPLIKAHLQSAVNWEQSALPGELNTCYRCHIHAQGLVGLGASAGVSGIAVNPVLAKNTFDFIVQTQNGDGSWHTCCQTNATTSAAWALSYWTDPAQAQPTLTKALNYLLGRMDGDGGYSCDNCITSFTGRETVSMFAMVAYSRGWEQTHDPNYQNAMVRLTNWGLNYNYQATASTGPEFAARIGIGLAFMAPDLQDPSLAAAAKKRVQDIAQFLRNQQQPDGSFGALPQPDFPIIRTAQSVYVLVLAGTPGSDPGLRNAVLWLINHQLPSGGFSEWRSEFTSPVHWFDETTWAMIALPAAFLRIGQFDVDYNVFLPSTSDLTTASPPPTSISLASGGKQYVWHLSDVGEAGADVSYNVRLNGLTSGETRPATGAESIAYTDPYSGTPVTRDLTVPSVTGYGPLKLAIATDKPMYGPAAPVVITETVANVGTTNESITNDLQIRDANGTVVATLAAGDPVQGLPPAPFPGWHFTVPVSAPVTADGVSRTVTATVDFSQFLTALGATGTFDVNSLRVSSDAAPSSELYFTYLPADATNPVRGSVVIRIPDAVAAGSTFSGHIFFDVIDNGAKPISQFNQTFALGNGQGLTATYGYLDTGRMNPYTSTPDGIVYVPGPPALKFIQPNSYITAPGPPRYEYWGTEWTGGLLVPASGTYQFLLGADDGAWVYIDGQLVVSEPGLHGTYETTGSVTLTAGMHSFRVDMFNWCCGYNCYIRWAPPGQGWNWIPTANLFPAMPASSGTTVGAPQTLADGTATLTYNWNTGTTAAGPYTAVGTIRQYGAFVGSAAAPFSITPASQINATVGTDKPAYDPNNVVHATGSVVYSAGNTPVTNLSATIAILDPSGAVLTTSPATTIANLVPGQSAPVRFDWNVAQSAPGRYSAKLVVVDASNTERAEAVVPFDVRSTSQTGRGLTGTISTVASIYQGETLPISVGVTNNGNAALTNAPFAVQIVDPATQNLVDTIPFTASIATGATYSTTLSKSGTASMKAQVYQLWLVSTIGGTATPLANTTFELKLPPLKLELSQNGPARVLIWANCSNGNSAQPCTPVQPPFITKTLTDAGIPWTLVGDQQTFVSDLRTGAYTEAIIYQPGQFEAKIADEYLESIRSGFGLLYVNNDTDANPKLAPALQTSFGGKLNATSTLLNVADSPFTTAGTIAFNGNSVNLSLSGAKAAATIAATGAPALTYATLGLGKSVVLPFDIEKTTTTDAAALLLNIVRYISRVPSTDARQVVPIDFKVTAPPGGGTINLTIGATLPDGMSVVFAQPALSSTSPLAWNIAAPAGQDIHLVLWVRLPDAVGSYTVTGTAAFAGQVPVVTKTLTLTVAADRAAIESALASDLATLSSAAPASDQHALSDAAAQLTALRALGTDAPSVATAIADALAIINDLKSLSIDSSAARRDADRLLVWWQSRSAL